MGDGKGWLILAGLAALLYFSGEDEGKPSRARRNPFFGLFGSDERDDRPTHGGGARRGGKLHEYDAECYSKCDPKDVYPAQTFSARNKTEAKKQVVRWLRGAGYSPSSYTIKIFSEGEG
jgi:hypothetical protein